MSKFRTILILIIFIASLLPPSGAMVGVYAQQANINDAVSAVVRILGCNVAGCNVGLGSGVIIHPSGVILTANHVTLANLKDPSSHLEDFLIEMTTNAQMVPQPRFRARLIATKSTSDLALLRIYWDQTANRPVDATTLEDLPTLPLADANTIVLGERLHILGYPLAGGQAVNYIPSVVGGFDENNTLVKVPTTLSEGNSGGPAFVERNGHFEIAGIVLLRRGTLGEIGFIRRIDQMQELDWQSNSQRVWATNIQVKAQGTGATASLQIRADIHALDMVNRHVYLLAYAFEANTYHPWRPASKGLPQSATGQIVFSQEFVAKHPVETAQTITLEQRGLGADPAQLLFRLLLWDSEATQVLWQDVEWRHPQSVTAVALATLTPTVTQTSVNTPVSTTLPINTATPHVVTATTTSTSDLMATATAIAQLLATSIAATQTALPTNTPTSPPTPTKTPSSDATIKTAVAATLTALSTDTPTRMPTYTPTATVTPTRIPSPIPTNRPTATWTPIPTPTQTPTPSPCKPGVIYCENFESGRANGWSLFGKFGVPSSGWKVVRDGANYVFNGEGHEWAVLESHSWDNYRVRFRFKLLSGELHLNYRVEYNSTTRWNSRYYVIFQEGGLILNKSLDNSGGFYMYSVENIHTLETWHNAEVVGWGGHLQVYIDHKLELDYIDSTPLLRGTIAFETVDNSAAQIDDIEVMAAGPESASVSSCHSGVLYCEDFENERADGWTYMNGRGEPSTGWKVIHDGANYVFSGEGHEWATLDNHSWDDYRFRFRLKLIRGVIHLNYRIADGRYFVGFNEDGLYLKRQIQDSFTDLTSTSFRHQLNHWYQIEIAGRGGHLQVYIDGKLELDYTDSKPLLKGSIAFESLDDSAAQVDDIEVAASGPESVSSQTSTSSSHPELLINASTLNIRDGPGSGYKVLGVANSGERYTITGRNSDNTWWQIDFNGRNGWVSGGYIKLLNPNIDVPVTMSTSLGPASTTEPIESESFTEPKKFQAAISNFGRPEFIDFENINASPVNNTFMGRKPLTGSEYSNLGIAFSSPRKLILYIAPGGLPWNPSNSLSVGEFPNDTNIVDNNDDSLLITFNPPVRAIGFTLVESNTRQQSEFVRFIDAQEHIIKQVGLPSDFTPNRAFVGVMSITHPIASVYVKEADDDSDDIDYDDFIFLH